jgi:hypothetical protein
VKFKFSTVQMPMKNNLFTLLSFLLALGQAHSQEVIATVASPFAAAAAIPAFQVLSETTVQQKDGSSITFRQVVPPVVAPPQAPPTAALAPAPALNAAEAAAVNPMPVKEVQMLSISASVQANGLTMLRWTCGASQRLQAVSNVDFRALAGLGSLETAQASYFLILSAGPTDEALSAEEAQAAQALRVNGAASFALLPSSAAASTADEASRAALNAMASLLDYFDAHREALVQQQAQREAANAARALAALNAPLPPPRHSIVHFWPLQPAQRAAINEQVQRAALLKAVAQPATPSVTKGGTQP